MTTTLKVVRFDDRRLCSECEVIQSDLEGLYKGRRVFVDLTVDAGFGDMPEVELVGSVVEVDRFQPHELIGIGVRRRADLDALREKIHDEHRTGLDG